MANPSRDTITESLFPQPMFDTCTPRGRPHTHIRSHVCVERPKHRTMHALARAGVTRGGARTASSKATPLQCSLSLRLPDGACELLLAAAEDPAGSGSCSTGSGPCRSGGGGACGNGDSSSSIVSSERAARANPRTSAAAQRLESGAVRIMPLSTLSL